jgi:hypothetical protein
MQVMEADTNKKNADQHKAPDQQKNTEKTNIETPINKNPNPRANGNMTEQDKQDAPTSGVGSEITDGEGG